jgi:hypothetical protein
MNFGELKAEVFRRLYEDSTAPIFWSEDDVMDAINEGYMDFCEQTKCYERQAEVACTSKIPYLDVRTALAYPFIGLRRIYSRLLQGPLQSSSVKSMDDRDRRWEMSFSLPRRMTVRGLYTIMLYPVPPSEATFRMSWSSLPEKLVFDEDEPQIPIESHEAIVKYALYDLKCQEAETEVAMKHWQSYRAFVDEGAQTAKSLIKTSRTFVMGERYVG